MTNRTPTDKEQQLGWEYTKRLLDLHTELGGVEPLVLAVGQKSADTMGKFDIDRPIAELFSVEPYALRIRNVCNSHDIATIRELCLHSNWDLLHFRHLGERSIAHMEEMLGNFGLRLGMTEEDLDAYMRFETEDDKDVTTIMRFEESEEVKWDQRRYEVARDLYVRYRGLSPYEAMEEAEKLILALQGVPEKNNRSKRRGNIFNR